MLKFDVCVSVFTKLNSMKLNLTQSINLLNKPNFIIVTITEP